MKCTACERSWPVRQGIPHLVFPERLERRDARTQRFWDRLARFYDLTSAVTAIQRGVPETQERRDLISRLELAPAQAFLEVAAGTGSNLKVVAEQTGGEVAVFGLDLSPRMLSVAARKLKNMRRPPVLVLGNAMVLPFADGVFDAVLGGYGTKYFSDKAQAIREMIRVVKPRGKVVVTDLGLPAGKRPNLRQRILLLWIPGFREGPPLDAIPADVEDLKLDWDAPETAYTIEFRKPVS